MKTFLLALLIFALPAQAGVVNTAPPVVPSITVGSRAFTNLTSASGLIILYAAVNVAASSKYSTMRKLSIAANGAASSAGYQVTAGKSLVIWGCRTSIDAAGTAGQALRLAYGDTDVGFNSASAPTNITDFAGAAGSSFIVLSPLNAITADTDSAVLAMVPAAKWPVVYAAAGTTDASTWCFGYEN